MPENIVITAELKDLISGHLKEITSQVDRMDGALSNIGKNQQGSGGIMGSVLGANLLTAAIEKSVGAIYNFGQESLAAYGRQEGYEARMTTLLGSRKQAELAISNLRKDAATTPFDMGSLIQGNSLLIGSGESAKGARKSIMDLGNAIAATGGGSDELSRMAVNLGQIKSIGKASALDVKQFMYANIPIYELLATSMKKPISKIKEMDITYKDLTKALSDARQEGGKFYMGLENASNTLVGLQSNLDDTIESLKTNIGENFADSMKDSIRSLIPFLDGVNERMGLINKTSRVLSKENLSFSFAENNNLGTSSKTEMTAFQDYLDKHVNYAKEGGVQTIETEDNLNKILKKISKDYQANEAVYSLSGEDKPDAQKYLREVALIKDALATVKESYTVGKKDDAKNGGSAKVGDLETVAKANRPTQVNINIENLVREYKPQVEDNGKAIYKVTQEDVAKALIAAVNDVSVMQFGN